MSNEKINTVAEEEVLENVEFTRHAQDTVTGNSPKVEEVKENTKKTPKIQQFLIICLKATILMQW